jgi:Phosphotransferase enzyme family
VEEKTIRKELGFVRQLNVDELTEMIPLDPAIPALDVFRADGLRQVLSSLGIQGEISEFRLIRLREERRCTWSLKLGSSRVVIKAYAKDPSPVVEMSRRLGRYGAAAGVGPMVARLIGFDPDLKIVVTAHLGGPTAVDLVNHGDGARAGRLAATWLCNLGDFPVETGQPWDCARIIDKAAQRVRRLEPADPGFRAEALASIDALRDQPPALASPRLCHGDYAPRHVFDLDEGAVAIDIDEFCYGAIELDAGLFLARMWEISTMPPLTVEAERACGSFREGLGDRVQRDALPWYEAAGLIRQAVTVARKRRDGWRQRAGALLTRSDRVLQGV